MDHLTLPLIARLLAADDGPSLEPWVRHLAEVCPDCARQYAEAEALMRRFKHWDPAVTILEGLEADRLFAALTAAGGGYEAWGRQVDEHEDFQTWGVAWVALERARAILTTQDDAARSAEARDLALLAARIAEGLGSSYHPEWAADLKALGYATAAMADKLAGTRDLQAQIDRLVAAAAALDRGTGEDVGREVRGLLFRVLGEESPAR